MATNTIEFVEELINSWGNYESVAMTARDGLSEEDQETIFDWCDQHDYRPQLVARAVVQECRDRVEQREAELAEERRQFADD